MRTGERSGCVEHRSPIRGTGVSAPGRSLLYGGRLRQKLRVELFNLTKPRCLPPALQVRQLRVQLFFGLFNRNNLGARSKPLIGAEEEWGFRGKKPPLPK